jgi:hypothetical protein
MISSTNDSAILDLCIYQKHTDKAKEEEFSGGIREFISGLLARQGEWAGFASLSNVEATILLAANPWLSFLKSLELFVAAVDAIAEV